jgi:hypothetical protein
MARPTQCQLMTCASGNSSEQQMRSRSKPMPIDKAKCKAYWAEFIASLSSHTAGGPRA